MPEPSRYTAFLSYSHADTEIAVRWHERLEDFKVPNVLVGTEGTRGPVPHTLQPIFRDRLDFSANRELQPATREALDRSDALILIATPNAAASAYVNEEVRYFRHHHHPARPLIVILEGPEGVAFEDCMPKALRFGLDTSGAVTETPYSHLAADTRRDGLETVMAKVIGDLVGLEPIQVKPRVEEWLRTARENAARLDRVSDGIDRLEAMLSGAKTVAELRGYLRGLGVEIDQVPDDRLTATVQGLIEELKKPGANPADFEGAVRTALATAQARIDALALDDADRILAEELDRTADIARGRAAMLAERGRVARLQLRYRDAARFYTAASGTMAHDDRAAWDYATDAAGALYSHGDEFGDNAALTDAIQRYRTALALAPRDRSAEDWATTQIDLGNALCALGARESSTTHLEAAVAAHRAASEVRTRATDPQGWAAAQNNLGNALWRLGARESGTTRLEEAVAAYRDALLVHTRESVPLHWATTQNNLAACRTYAHPGFELES